jgi:hypothetical protein
LCRVFAVTLVQSLAHRGEIQLARLTSFQIARQLPGYHERYTLRFTEGRFCYAQKRLLAKPDSFAELIPVVSPPFINVTLGFIE